MPSADKPLPDLVQILTHRWDDLRCMAWSPDARYVAIGDWSGTIWIRDSATGEVLRVLEGHGDRVWSVAWDGAGQRVASGSADQTVRIWEAATGEALRVLEGHRDRVWSVVWLDDGRLVSSDDDGTVIVWDATTGRIDARVPGLGYRWIGRQVSVRLGPVADRQLGDFVRIRSLGAATAAAAPVSSVRFRSTKIVLVGESEQGKTCLALRLAEGRYEERGTTHGMQIWTLAPTQIGQPETQDRREIFLWDFGGQPEYQLVHQAFLHDTTFALFLFDPTRGEVAFADVEKWNRRLEAQLRGKKAVKLLVRSKLDQNPDYQVDRAAIERLQAEHGFAEYLEVSAKKPKYGFDEFQQELGRLIDWDRIEDRCRLKLWQDAYEAATEVRKSGRILLSEAELRQQLQDLPEFDEGDFQGAIESLAQQGIVVTVDGFQDGRVLILGVDHIDRYAGSIVRAARDNPRRIAAVEEATLHDRTFTEIPEDQRIADVATRTAVLEAVKQLLVEKSIALRSQGLLIFPSESSGERDAGTGDLPVRVAVHLSFEGAVNNLYASTVCMLERGERFGPVRLWRNWAQFERSAEVCAVQLVDLGAGRAKFELHFGEKTHPRMRETFEAAIEDHLRREGAEVTLGYGFQCDCGHPFEDQTVQKRLDGGHREIACPVCEKRHEIFRRSPHAKLGDYDVYIWRRASRQAPTSPAAQAHEATRPHRVLHLSDLHFKASDNPNTVLQPLLTDLRNFEPVHYLVVSGDLADKADHEGFAHAQRFLLDLVKDLHLTKERVVMTPGNHDVDESVEAHDWVPKKRLASLGLTPENAVSTGGGVFRIELSDIYPRRFEKFRTVYHHVTGVDYPLSAEAQCHSRPYETGLQFLALNSAWHIDEYNRMRVGLNHSAREQGMKEVTAAMERSRYEPGRKLLRIAVWHHAVSGDRKIPDADLAFLERLADEGFCLVLHGDVHEVRAGIENTFDKGIYVAGAGSLHSDAAGRPESTPRLYNVLEIDPGFAWIKVHVRAQDIPGGRFDEYARWPHPTGKGKVGYFEIKDPRTWIVP